jgi:hypothetical protein
MIEVEKYLSPIVAALCRRRKLNKTKKEAVPLLKKQLH